MFAFLTALRPQQWSKNLFVLAALIFSGHLFDPSFAARSALAFLLFCLISGTVYIFNDIRDLERDRRHPEKQHRPIVSGKLSIRWASVGAFVIVVLAFLGSFRLNVQFGWVVLSYAVLNVAYSLYLKKLVILDVMIVAAGFLLRAVGGAFVIEVAISSWFILCTMLLALFLGFVKRRQELVLLDADALNHRRSLEEYSLKFLDQMISIVTAGALITYALYTMSPEVMEKLGTQYLNLTIPFVIYGLLRYLYLVYTKGEGGNPSSTIMRDLPLLINGGLWLITLVGVLYLT